MIAIIDKELKKLSRTDLIEIIYRYQQREQELADANKKLQQELDDRQIKLENVGSIAEAALALNDVFATAQKAADQYLENIKQLQQQAEQAAQPPSASATTADENTL